MREEQKLQRRGYKRIAGLDEVGRGPLAGPVVAAAVVLMPKLHLSMPTSRLGKLRDSKQLSSKQREEWYRLFLEDSKIQWGIGKVSEKIIDRINILQATRLAMEKAVRNLEKKLQQNIDFLLIDGIFTIDTFHRQRAVKRGDERILSCAVASIVAKVSRDRLMDKYHLKYPEYGFDKHKGYGTTQHLKMLLRHGPCPIHRTSFRPLAHLVK